MSNELKMPQINNCIFSGRLVYDGKLERGASGKEYSRNRLAIGEGYGDGKTTSFLSLVAFGKQATGLAGMRKGDPVVVQGAWRMNKREKGEEVIEMPELTAWRVDALAWPKAADAEPKAAPHPLSTKDDDMPF